MYSSITDQARAISKYLGAKLVETIDLSDRPSTLPDGVDWNFVIPSWRLIAPTYSEAVSLVIGVLKMVRGAAFKNWKEGEIDAAHLRQLSPRDLHGVYAVQLGSRHRGKSVEDVRHFFDGRTDEAALGAYEVALGAYEVAMIFLSNPGIKPDGEWWGIDCAADEWSYGGDSVFSSAPVFCFAGDRFKFGADDVSDASAYFGSSSLFIPQLSPDPQSLNLAIETVKAAGYVVYKPI